MTEQIGIVLHIITFILSGIAIVGTLMLAIKMHKQEQMNSVEEEHSTTLSEDTHTVSFADLPPSKRGGPPAPPPPPGPRIIVEGKVIQKPKQ